MYRLWTKQEVQELKTAYTQKHRKYGFLVSLAKKLRRDKSNVARKARSLRLRPVGLPQK